MLDQTLRAWKNQTIGIIEDTGKTIQPLGALPPGSEVVPGDPGWGRVLLKPLLVSQCKKLMQVDETDVQNGKEVARPGSAVASAHNPPRAP